MSITTGRGPFQYMPTISERMRQAMTCQEKNQLKKINRFMYISVLFYIHIQLVPEKKTRKNDIITRALLLIHIIITRMLSITACGC